MVNLPTVSDRLITTEAPRSSVTGRDIQQNANLMAGAVDKAADALMDVSVEAAKKQAGDDLINQKVTRDADGNVSVATPENSMIFGRAGEAYDAAVKAGTVAANGNIVSQGLAELHAKYPLDHEAFNAAASSFIQKHAQAIGGPVGESILREGAQLQTQHNNAIVNAAATNDIDNQKKSLTSQIEEQRNTAIGLARQPGGPDSPEFQQAVQKMNLSYDALGKNPLFKMPLDQIEREKNNTASLLQGEALVAHIDSTFTKKGKAEAQQELQQILQNPNLREADRSRLYTQGLSRLGYLTADAKEKIDAGRKDIGELETNLASGKVKPEDPVVGMSIQAARDRGDSQGVQRITAAAAVRTQMRGVQSLPDAVRNEVLGVTRSGVVNPDIPVEGRALLDSIARTESAGRYNVRYGGKGDVTFQGFGDHPRIAEPITSGPDVGKTSTAAGRYQFIQGTWDAQAKKLGLKDFSPANQDAAAWDLAQTEYKNKTGKDLLTVLRSGDAAAINDVPRQLSGQWSSLPGGRQPAGGGAPFVSNLAAADRDLHLTPEEKSLYQRHLTNLTGPGGVDNPDGTRSTLFQTTVEHDGKFYTIPTVWDGKILWDKNAADPAAAAIERVKQTGWDKFPSYATEAEAEARYQKMHAYLEKDTESYKQSKVQPRAIAPAANGGPGFTYADVQRNPFLTSAYVRTLAADQEGRVTAAKQTATSIGKALDVGLIPSPQSVAEVRQAAALYPDKMGAVAEEMEGRLTGGQIAALPQGQRDQVVAAYKAATDGQDVHHQNIAAAALKQDQEARKNLAEHPYQEAMNRGWIPQPAAPIDPAQPDAIPAALAQRAVLSARIGSMNQMPPPPLLDKDEVPALQAALQGPQGGQVLGGIAQALKPDEMARFLKQKEFADSVIGMMSSKDPAQMSTAMSVVDKLWRENAAQAKSVLGDAAITKLQAWQGLKGSFNATELAERLNASDDPSTLKARTDAKEAAETETAKLTPADMAYKLGTSWGIPILSRVANVVTGATPAVPFDSIKGGELVNDYRATYAALRSYGVDTDKASSLAVERVAKTWSVSQAAGNQVMKNAPEQYYPTIGGTHDWMVPAVKDFVKKHAGDESSLNRSAEATFGGEQRNWTLAGLVSDGRTQAEIAAGRPPSYQVAITRKDGTLEILPSRMAFDPTDEIAKHGAQLESQQQAAEWQQHGQFGNAMPLP